MTMHDVIRFPALRGLWRVSAFLVCGCVGATTLVSAATPPAPVTREVARGPHHKVCEYVVTATNAEGRIISQTNRYTALASGMHVLRESVWVDATGEVEILPNGEGAISRQAQIKVTFAPNINTPGAITTLTPDNKRFVTHVLGLALTDDASGKSLLIAPIKDSVGAVRGNQVAYRDAFENLRADIVYTCTKGKFEQDIVLRENIPFDPARLGFAADKSRLEVWTEVVEAPEPVKEKRIVATETNTAARTAMTQPDLLDETLNFGATIIGRGRAFITCPNCQFMRPA